MTTTEIERALLMYDRNEDRSAPLIDVKAIVNALSKIYSNVEVQPDREYVYGKEMVITFSARSDVTKLLDTGMAASIWISFLSPYATIVWKQSRNSKESTGVAQRDVSEFYAATHQKILAVLKQNSCSVIPDELLHKYLPGRTNQMDGSAVTVFGALFSELG